jgi:hypothetical protein
MRFRVKSRSLFRRPSFEHRNRALATDTALRPKTAEVRFMQRAFAEGKGHELLDGTHLVLARAIPHVGEIE